MCCSFAVASPVFEVVHYCQELLIVDFEVDFHWLELSGVERHWVQAILVVPLGQDCPNCKI